MADKRPTDDAPTPNTGTLLASQRSGASSPGTQLRRSESVRTPQQNESSSNATEFTEYRHVTQSNHSTGFNKAKEIAEAAIKQEGTFLKKRFVLEEVLGRGGMGVVYKTRDLRKVEAEDENPYVAAKILGQNFKDHPDAFVTLQQEAVKSQKLAHPNIVTVYDFDRDGDIVFMTMELLNGVPLDKLLKQHQATGIPKATAMKLFGDLCLALSYAHKQGLIHADFKPGNIFVMHHGGGKVLDFGIARAVSQQARKGKFDVGDLGALTPSYATIEMVDGKPPSFSDDVYALACVTYEMFSGRHPFARASAKDAQHAGLKPQRLKVLSRREWKALSRALSFDKTVRTPTIDVFMHELLPRKISTALQIAAGLFLLALAGAGWFGYQQYRSQRQITRTIEEKLALAQTCFDKRDFACAVEQAQVAVNLDADNAAARQLLAIAAKSDQESRSRQRIEQLLQEAQSCIGASDYECARVKLTDVLNREPDNAVARQLQSSTAVLITDADIREMLSQAETCLSRNDLDCAQLFFDKAAAISPRHADTLAFLAKLQSARSVLARQASQRESLVLQLIEAGSGCLRQNDFSCAMAKADAALALMPSYSQAVALKQRAVVASEQHRTAVARADELVNQAAACLKAGNFNCAVAKSDSALDFVPQYPKALQLKQQAQARQEQLKRSISIK